MSIVRGGRRYRTFSGLRYVALAVLALLFLIPFYLLVRNALTDQSLLVRPEWRWWPGEFKWAQLAPTVR